MAQQAQRCHYDVLGLPKDCTQKDIRQAYVRLCKEFHPDRNLKASSLQHHRFVQLNEAYQVLIRVQSRKNYDLALQKQSAPKATFHPRQDSERVVWRDETLWEMRDKSKDKEYADKPYYGIKGVKRIPTVWIGAGCVLLMMVGTLLHSYTINPKPPERSGRSLILDRFSEAIKRTPSPKRQKKP